MAGFRLDRAQPVIEQIALVIVEVPWISAPRVELARQLHHVVGAATLLVMRARAPLRRETARRGHPALVIAASACGIGPGRCDRVPEELRHVVEPRIAGQLEAPGCADHLRNVRVHVKPAQFVPALRERGDEILLVEAVAHFRPAIVVSGGGKIVKRLTHSAKFNPQNLLHAGFWLRSAPLVHPGSHAAGDFERLLVAGMEVHVEHARQDLVVGVEGRPNAPSLVQTVEELEGKRAQIAAACQLVLTARELGDHFVAARFHLRISSRRGQQGARGQIVSRGMAAKLAAGRFPSAERLRGAGEAGVQAKRVQEPVRRDAHHVRAVVARGLLARASQEAHLRHGVRRNAQFGILPREDESPGERRLLDDLRPSSGRSRNLRGGPRDRRRTGSRLLSDHRGRTRDCGCKEPPGPFQLAVHWSLAVVILAQSSDVTPKRVSLPRMWMCLITSERGAVLQPPPAGCEDWPVPQVIRNQEKQNEHLESARLRPRQVRYQAALRSDSLLLRF